MLFEFGIARVATYHYALPISPAPLALLMNRKKFDSSAGAAQEIIRKHSGEWAAARFIEGSLRDRKSGASSNSNPTRDARSILPSPSDLEQAEAVFKAVIDDCREQERAQSGAVARLPHRSLPSCARPSSLAMQFRRTTCTYRRRAARADRAGRSRPSSSPPIISCIRPRPPMRQHWARYVAENVNDLEQIAGGERPSSRQHGVLRGRAAGAG